MVDVTRQGVPGRRTRIGDRWITYSSPSLKCRRFEEASAECHSCSHLQLVQHVRGSLLLSFHVIVPIINNTIDSIARVGYLYVHFAGRSYPQQNQQTKGFCEMKCRLFVWFLSSLFFFFLFSKAYFEKRTYRITETVSVSARLYA